MSNEKAVVFKYHSGPLQGEQKNTRNHISLKIMKALKFNMLTPLIVELMRSKSTAFENYQFDLKYFNDKAS